MDTLIFLTIFLIGTVITGFVQMSKQLDSKLDSVIRELQKLDTVTKEIRKMRVVELRKMTTEELSRVSEVLDKIDSE